MADGKNQHLALRTVISIVLVALILGGAVTTFEGLKARKKAPERIASEPPPPTVRTMTATPGTWVERLTGYGSARAMVAADVAAEVAGVIEWIAPELEPGALVEAGQPLIRLDPRDLEQLAASRRADLQQAEAKLAQTHLDVTGVEKRLEVSTRELTTIRAELASISTLTSQQVVSQNDLDRLQRQQLQIERQVVELEALRGSAGDRIAWDTATRARAEAALRQAEIDLARAEIAAPYAGRIVTRHAELGERVAIGTLLFHIVDLSRVEVAVSLPASRLRDVAIGARAELLPREGAAPIWSGRVARVAANVDTENRTFLAYLEVPGEAGHNPIAPGEFVVATITGREHQDVIALPRIAFVDGAIYLATPDAEQPGKFLARAVTPTVRSHLADVTLIEIDLPQDSRIIISNVERLGDGSRIAVLGDDAAASAAEVPP